MFPAAACHYPQKNEQVWGQPEDKNLQSLLLQKAIIHSTFIPAYTLHSLRPYIFEMQQNIFSRLASRIQPVKKFYETTAFNISFFTVPVFLFL